MKSNTLASALRRFDFLDHDVQRRSILPVSGILPLPACARRIALLQVLEIRCRIVQAVGVIDAKSVHLAFGGEIEEEAVRRLERRAIADFRVKRCVIDDVVAVPASGTRAQVGRTIDVAHAQRGEIRHDRRGVGEGELAVQLQALGGAGRVADQGPMRA
jgi:hypothetical protein